MDVTIKITHGDPATCKLTLSDGGLSNVKPGDKVTWEIVPGSGVKQIINIIVDAGSHDVFKPDPAPVKDSDPIKWTGTINPDIKEVVQENYTIEWSTAGSGWLNEGAGKICAFDPIIRVNPQG